MTKFDEGFAAGVEYAAAIVIMHRPKYLTDSRARQVYAILNKIAKEIEALSETKQDEKVKKPPSTPQRRGRPYSRNAGTNET